jgi:hypothetical protein
MNSVSMSRTTSFLDDLGCWTRRELLETMHILTVGGFSGHVIPRLALLLFLLWCPREQDCYSLDHWLARKANQQERAQD